MAHTLKETIDLAMKNAILRAHPIGSYYLTEGTENPQDFIGGGWQKLTGRYVLQCSDDTHAAGTTVQAGLPNIEGNIVFELPGGNSPISSAGYRALYNNYSTKSISGYVMDGSSVTRSTDKSLRFDASRSNPLYGNSDTVQPPARIVNVWKRVS